MKILFSIFAFLLVAITIANSLGKSAKIEEYQAINISPLTKYNGLIVIEKEHEKYETCEFFFATLASTDSIYPTVRTTAFYFDKYQIGDTIK